MLLGKRPLLSHARLPAQDEWPQKAGVATDCMCAIEDSVGIIGRQLKKFCIFCQLFTKKLPICRTRDDTASYRPCVFAGPFYVGGVSFRLDC